MNKKLYFSPKLKLVAYEQEDIMTVSNEGTQGDYFGTEDPWGGKKV